MSTPDPPVDPRGVRLAAALLTGSGRLQGVVFALGASAGPRFAPYPVPRLSPPTEREDAAPVRFSQLVGLFLFLSVAGTVGSLTGRTVLGVVAFLNAASGFRLGCEMYTVNSRIRDNELGATA